MRQGRPIWTTVDHAANFGAKKMVPVSMPDGHETGTLSMRKTVWELRRVDVMQHESEQYFVAALLHHHALRKFQLVHG